MAGDVSISNDHAKRDCRTGWLLLLCGVPLTAGGVLMMLHPVPDKPDQFLTGLGATALFGLAMLMGVYKLFGGRGELGPVDTAQTYMASSTALQRALATVLLPVLAAVGVAMLIYTPDYGGSARYQLGALLAAGSGILGTGFMIYQMFSNKWKAGPMYSIGPGGITLHHMNELVLPWQDVARISIQYFRRNPMIAVVPADWRSFLANQSNAFRASNQLTAQMGLDQGVYLAPTAGLPSTKLIQVLEAFAKEKGIPVDVR